MTLWTAKLIDRPARRRVGASALVVGYGLAAVGSLGVWSVLVALVIRAL